MSILTNSEDLRTILAKVNALPDAEGGGIIPTGTLEIIENGEYDVTSYANVSVNVEKNSEQTPFIITGINILEMNSEGSPMKIKTIGMTNFPSGIFRNVNDTIGFASALEEITFDASAKVLEGTVCRNTANLTKITFEGTPDSIAANAFYSATSVTEINCPWLEGELANAPWGCSNATINYGYMGE